MKYLISIFIILYVLLTIWAFLDIIYCVSKKDRISEPYWIFIIILFPLIGSILYFHFKHKKRMRRNIFTQQ